MKTHLKKTHPPNHSSRTGGSSKTSFQFSDKRSETIKQVKLQKLAIRSPPASKLSALQKIANGIPTAQLQKDSEHVESNGSLSFYRFNSTNTDNHVDGTRGEALAKAQARLGSIGKKKLDKVINSESAQRNGKYVIHEFDAERDKVLVEHTEDDQATLSRYYNWKKQTKKGNRDKFNTVKHFHAGTIGKVPGASKSDYNHNLGKTFPAYTAIGGDHHYYYIDITTPSASEKNIDISVDEIDEK